MNRASEQILTEWLVLQIQGGNRKARETLLEMWYPLLRRYAQTLLGHREDAQDAVQDTLVKMDTGIHTLRDPAAFPKWVYRILHRRCTDQLRGRQRRRWQVPLPQDADCEEHNTLVVEQDGALTIDMHRALATLKPESYLVIHLYYLHDLDLAAIADITATPPGTVKSRLFTARKALQQQLGGYDEQN
jgi:RNA polymerase sigma factor (sigma-70 family)